MCSTTAISLVDGDRTAVADTSRGERLIHALAISFVGAAAATSVLLLVHFRRAADRSRVFVTCFTWGVVSALFLPADLGQDNSRPLG